MQPSKSTAAHNHSADIEKLVHRVINHDKFVIHGLQDDCDTTLLVAALLGAIITTFAIEQSKELRPNDSQAVVDALLVVISGMSNISSTIPLPKSSLEFSNSSVNRTVNLLWFISLVNSLFVALMSMVMKQWLRENPGWSSLSGELALRVRQIRWEKLQEHNIQFKIALLPTLLQISVILFIAGLIVYLFDLDRQVAHGVIVVVALAGSAIAYFVV
ncbi:hypothetical protein DL96DRAFT_1475950, partial [Flagelloscypha sp. PMI_526]